MATYSFEDDIKKGKSGYSFEDDQPAPKREATGGSRVQAAAAGINRGFFADLAGLPVDTVANVLDLGKAAIGVGITEATGKAAPEWTQPFDRSRIVGAGEWNARKINDIGLGGGINNPNPEDGMSRILHTGGRVAGASVVPSRAAISLSQNAVNMAKGGVGGIAAGSVGEVAPEWAGLAGMAPQAMMAGGAAALRHSVRGGESGRQAMEQRMQDLQNGGVTEPSAGLASGNRMLMGIENILSQTPGSIGLYERARAKNVDGMRDGTHQIRDSASREFGPAQTGQAIQSDLKTGFKDRINGTFQELNDRFAGRVSPGERFPIAGTLDALNATTAVNPLAPATTASFVQPRISKLREHILQDTTETVRGLDYQTRTRNIGMPLPAIKDVRTDIGKEAASRAIFGTPEQADFKQLYAGLSRDMKKAAQITDRNAGPQPNNIGRAETALNRSNRYYSAGMKRADDLSGITNNAMPEGAYNSVVRSLNSGGTLYAKLRNAVSPDTRGKLVASIIDDMGRATPGQQDATGELYSPRTFLTNYNKIDAGARAELFKGIKGGGKLADNLADVAKTADMLSDSSKVWANPSGTSQALVARGTFGTIGAGVALGAFYTPLLAPAGIAAGSLLAANQVSKRLLLNPVFVNWLAKAPRTSTAKHQQYAQRLLANARMTNDSQFREDVDAYLTSVEQGGNGNEE